MSSAEAFDPSEIFDLFAMQPVDSQSFDTKVVSAPGSDLRCIFMWGTDCYNCTLFKKSALLLRDQLLALDLTWYHSDVYQDEALGRRFGLHGVPAFVFYRSGKRLGRISGWPGWPQFSGAVARLHAENAPKAD